MTFERFPILAEDVRIEEVELMIRAIDRYRKLLEQLDEPIAKVIDRFLRNIQVQRQDFNGRVLTIRASDVAVLSMLLDVPDGELVEQIRRQT